MFGFLGLLFDTGGFPPRWHCGQWSAAHGWLHVLSDLGTASAYTAIPAVLAYFVLKRRDVPLPRIFWLFSAFIFACGTTHLIDAVIFWWPAYRLSGAAKFATAVISWVTVIALVRVTPQALRLPGLAVVNAELRRVNADLDAFAHVVSHDLRAPLRGINTLAGWLRDDLRSQDGVSPEVADRLAQLERRVRDMDKMIEGMLQFARAGRTEPDGDDLDTHAITSELIRDLHAPDNVTVAIVGRLPRIAYGAVPFRQVMQNLLDNAVKYTAPAGGAVMVSARETRRDWEFAVADTGPGIDPAHHEAIFELFRTVEPRGDGTIGGVGLAIVRRVAERHGGRAWVASQPGGGATFRFTVPKAPPAAHAARRAVEDPA